MSPFVKYQSRWKKCHINYNKCYLPLSMLLQTNVSYQMAIFSHQSSYTWSGLNSIMGSSLTNACIIVNKYMDQNGLVTMLAIKMPAGVGPEVNLRTPLHESMHPGFETQARRSQMSKTGVANLDSPRILKRNLQSPESRYVNNAHWHVIIEFFHDRCFCQIIWQIFTQGRANKFRQKFPPMGIETRTSDHQANALPTELGRNLLGRRFLKWTLFHVPLHMLDLCSFLESIEHDFIKAMKIQASNWMWLSSVGKALAWWSGGPGFKPHWGQFLVIFFLLFPV